MESRSEEKLRAFLVLILSRVLPEAESIPSLVYHSATTVAANHMLDELCWTKKGPIPGNTLEAGICPILC